MKLYKFALPLMLAVVLAVFAACGDDDDEQAIEDTASPTAAAADASDGASDIEASLFSCDEQYPGTEPDASAFPVTLTDSSGNTVTLEEPPSKIASMSAAHTEVLFAIGAGAQVTAVDNYSDCPAAAASLPKLDAFTPSLEAITAQEPDLVILAYDSGDLTASLESAGIDVILQPFPATIDAVLDDIELIGQATGHAGEADALVTAMAAQVREIEASVAGKEAPTVYHELDNTYFSVGEGSFVDDMYTVLGADNIGHDTGEAAPQLSAEAIIAANPDVIILADEGFGESADTVAARPGWSNIDAVKNGRVYGVDPNIVSREGPRIVDALRILRDALYPD